MDSSLPLAGLQDKLRYGFSPFPERPPCHPVDLMQQTHEKNTESLHQFTLSNVYGYHMVMKLQMEKAILSQFQRLPGLPSSFCGLETLIGNDEDIDFDDYLNDPLISAEGERKGGIEEVVEERLHLGIQKLHAQV